MRLRMLPISLCLVFFAAASAASSAAAQTQEEAVVRTTYAKLAYALKIGAVHRAIDGKRHAQAADIEAQVAANELKFTLSDFTVGPLSSIKERLYGEFVTRPDGEDVLDVTPGICTHRDDSNENPKDTTEPCPTSAWTTGNNIAESDWNLDLGTAIARIFPVNSAEKAIYFRFASYRVTLSFLGRTRVYKAMFLFGMGDRPIIALDQVAGSVNAYVETSVYPEVLLESSQSRRPEVASWLRMHEMDSPSCRAGQKEVCCNIKALTCGIAPGDIRKALESPRSPLP
jgi:hypothetical protein